MNLLSLELRKARRTGTMAVLPAVGVLGAAYALANFIVRRDTLLGLPLAPMNVLLTQLYGVLMVLDLFGIVTAACMAFDLEFKGNAVQKMYLLPLRAESVYLCKFLLLAALLLAAAALQNGALAAIGRACLPPGTFEPATLLRFAAYSFATSLPVLSFMLLAASRSGTMWVPLGVGVAGFLSGMALANVNTDLTLAHPFVVMLRPAVAMSARPDAGVLAAALLETLVFLDIGLWLAKKPAL